MAVGLGSVDTPVPSVAEWEWLNWRFPRAVHAGETLYARWTLTQKRPPVAGAPTSIVVWRVDVHTADGALCAEGEIGAKVKRRAGQASARPQAAASPAAGQPPSGAPGPTGGSRRRRRRSSTNGNVPEPPAVAAPPAAAAKPERASGTSRRRRRRRSGGSPAQQEEHEPRAAHAPERAPEPVTGAAAAPQQVPSPAPPSVPARNSTTSGSGSRERGIGGVLKRLRRS
jgi:hypothetical protein